MKNKFKDEGLPIGSSEQAYKAQKSYLSEYRQQLLDQMEEQKRKVEQQKESQIILERQDEARFKKQLVELEQQQQDLLTAHETSVGMASMMSEGMASLNNIPSYVNLSTLSYLKQNLTTIQEDMNDSHPKYLKQSTFQPSHMHSQIYNEPPLQYGQGQSHGMQSVIENDEENLDKQSTKTFIGIQQPDQVPQEYQNSFFGNDQQYFFDQYYGQQFDPNQQPYYNTIAIPLPIVMPPPQMPQQQYVFVLPPQDIPVQAEVEKPIQPQEDIIENEKRQKLVQLHQEQLALIAEYRKEIDKLRNERRTIFNISDTDGQIKNNGMIRNDMISRSLLDVKQSVEKMTSELVSKKLVLAPKKILSGNERVENDDDIPYRFPKPLERQTDKTQPEEKYSNLRASIRKSQTNVVAIKQTDGQQFESPTIIYDLGQQIVRDQIQAAKHAVTDMQEISNSFQIKRGEWLDEHLKVLKNQRLEPTLVKVPEQLIEEQFSEESIYEQRSFRNFIQEIDQAKEVPIGMVPQKHTGPLKLWRDIPNVYLNIYNDEQPQ